jgi:hypothetical protein
MNEEQRKISDIARKLWTTLIENGERNLATAFKVEPKLTMTKQELNDWLGKNVFPGVSLWDEKYKFESIDFWNSVIAYYWGFRKKYLTDVYDCKVPDDLAFAYGLFFADGTCGMGKNGAKAGATWNIINSNKEWLERAKSALDWEYKDYLTFEIKQYPYYKKGKITNLGERKSDLYSLEAKVKRIEGKNNQGKRGDFIQEFRYLFYDPITKQKTVPKPIFDDYSSPRIEFLNGVIAGNGDHKNGYLSKKGKISVSKYNKRGVAELTAIMHYIGWEFSVRQSEKEFSIGYNRETQNIVSTKCDNYAFYFASSMANIFGLNTAGVASGEVYGTLTDKLLDRHAFNLIVATDNGVAKPYLFEPMKNIITEWKGQKTVLGDWKYVIQWQEFF